MSAAEGKKAGKSTGKKGAGDGPRKKASTIGAGAAVAKNVCQCRTAWCVEGHTLLEDQA
jgi:hypothetical protein